MLIIRQNKYGNKRTTLHGIAFDSQKEAYRYNDLLLLQRVGKISNLRRQVRFNLIPATNDERGVSYFADFTYTEDGKNIVEDVKSEATKKDKTYIIKRKLLKWRYPEIVFREMLGCD